MGFIQNLRDRVNSLVEAQKDKQEFLKLVEQETKPIRRSAYLKEKMKQAVIEGKTLAHQEFDRNKPKTKDDFGLSEGLQDPFKFINKSGDKTE